MKCKLFFLIGLIGVVFLVFFIGCENGASSSDNVLEPKKVVNRPPKPPKGTPSIFIPENSYEFPDVVDGEKISHDYIIENRGDRNLEITRVQTS